MIWTHSNGLEQVLPRQLWVRQCSLSLVGDALNGVHDPLDYLRFLKINSQMWAAS